MRIDRNLAPAARSSVLTVEVDGEQVLYDQRTGRLHALNGTAAVIWACCDGSATLDELVEELAEAFGASRREVRSGVYSTVRRLLDAGLITTGHPGDEAVEPLPSPADLGTPCTPCLAKLDALGWAGSISVGIGDLRTGVRATTDEGLALVQRLLAPVAIDDASAPIHYSVVLAETPTGRQSRELDQLYFGHHQVVRSRRRGRVLRALVAHLDGHLDSRRGAHLLVGGRALVRDDRVVLLSSDFRSDLDVLEPRLRRQGIAVCDAPSVELLGGGKASVTAPAIAVDHELLGALDASESARVELDQPAPGPRRLGGWVLPTRRLTAGDVPAPDALRAITATVRNLSAFGTEPALELLAGEVAQVPVRSAPLGPSPLFDEVRTLLGG